MWEQWYRSASAQQREQLLEQARQQGLLFSHQLPAAEDATDPATAVGRVAELLAGQATLDPLTAAPLEAIDNELDDCQRRAVALALATPDVALVLGYPGSGKSRVVAEILRQAARRGGRSLLVALDAAAVDRALERVAADPGVSVIRWHSDQEPATGAAARLTLAARTRGLHEQTLPAARRAADEAAKRLQRSRSALGAGQRLEGLLAEWEAARNHAESAAADRAALETHLPSEIDSSAEWHAVLREGEQELVSVEARLSELRNESEKHAADRKLCDDEQHKLAPLAEAKQGSRWWTGAFWRATIGGSPQPRLEELASRCQKICDYLDAIGREQAELEGRRSETLGRREERRQVLLASVRQRRLAEFDTRDQSAKAAGERAVAAWREAHDTAEPSRAAIDAARVAAEAEVSRLEAEVSQAKAWLAVLEQALPGLPTQLLAEARIVGATLGSLPRSPFPGHDLPEFDVVVLEEAHRASDADLMALAKRGRRLVLVGEAPPDLPVAPPPRRADRPRSIPTPPPFSRLWAALHPDPRRLDARCRHAHGRLIVTLRPLTPEQQSWLQREPVFDRPDIEVGIVSAPGQDPCVAEVIFPGAATVAEAKQFIHGELDELALSAGGLSPRWRETESEVAIDFAEADGDEITVPLAPGLTERVRRCPSDGEVHWQTTGLSFGRADGWDRAAAERWAFEKLGLREVGRTVVLGRDYRARPALSRFVSRLLYNEAYGPARETSLLSGVPAVQFVPVPPPGRGESRRPDSEPRRNGGGTATLAPRMRTARGGAGFEVDLADPRRPDALPHELRPHLPPRGLVNHLEAVAVVQELEAMAADPAFRAASIDWQRTRGAAVAAISAFTSQAELIQLLVRNSPALSGLPYSIDVLTPTEAAHRESLAVLVSLTRSHATRAVPFADHPNELVVALTRPAARLVVFGDAGTMNRRSQWFGALDHLDEITGPLEQALIAQLLAHMPEPEAAARGGRTLESSSV